MGWVELSVIVGLVSLFITVLVDMFSRAFGLQSASMWAKSEYAQVGVTFLIIMMADAIHVVGNEVVAEVATSVAEKSGNIYLYNLALANHNAEYAANIIAKKYIEQIIECESTIYFWVYWLNIFVEAFSKISFDVAHHEAIGAGIALTGWTTLFHYILNNIVYLVLFHYIQYDILLLSQYSMLQVFLPLGLVMRAFPLTRGAGGFVLAFALGFAFVFPMTYVMIIAMMPSAEAYCSQIEPLFQDSPFGTDDPCFNNAGSVMGYYYQVKNSESWISQVINHPQNTLSLLFLQAIFYPLASLIITISFIRQTGSLFGADLAEIGRGLIKLI